MKKAVEGGFSFNSSHNGLAIQKYVKSTGAGRHGPHPSYTNQIKTKLNAWAQSKNYSYTPAEAKQFLDVITDDIKYVIELPANQTTKINDLILGL